MDAQTWHASIGLVSVELALKVVCFPGPVPKTSRCALEARHEDATAKK